MPLLLTGMNRVLARVPHLDDCLCRIPPRHADDRRIDVERGVCRAERPVNAEVDQIAAHPRTVGNLAIGEVHDQVLVVAEITRFRISALEAVMAAEKVGELPGVAIAGERVLEVLFNIKGVLNALLGHGTERVAAIGYGVVPRMREADHGMRRVPSFHAEDGDLHAGMRAVIHPRVHRFRRRGDQFRRQGRVVGRKHLRRQSSHASQNTRGNDRSRQAHGQPPQPITDPGRRNSTWRRYVNRYAFSAFSEF